MADMTFNCPLCNQPIQCDEAWAGQQLQCPLCQGAIIAPPAPAAPPPAQSAPGATSIGKQLVAPPSGTKLNFQQNAQQPATTARNIPIRKLAPEAKKKRSTASKIIGITVTVLVLGVGVYFGWGFVEKWQQKANEKRRQVEKNSDGGEMGHIANLYDVLDATEVDGRSVKGFNRGGATGPRQRQGSAARSVHIAADGAPGDDEEAASATANLPVVPPAWTLEVEQAAIPESKVNGMISGTNFVAETVRLDAVGTAQVLRFIQGTNTSPDREILIYLHLKAGEKFSGRTWTISKDMRGAAVPQASKRWKTSPRYAPTLKSYSSGYAMKLEFGQMGENVLPGKIFIALPDKEQTVVAGAFTAGTSLTETAPAASDAAAPAPAPGMAPALPGAPAPGVAPAGMTPAQRAAYEKRYGVSR